MCVVTGKSRERENREKTKSRERERERERIEREREWSLKRITFIFFLIHLPHVYTTCVLWLLVGWLID